MRRVRICKEIPLAVATTFVKLRLNRKDTKYLLEEALTSILVLEGHASNLGLGRTRCEVACDLMTAMTPMFPGTDVCVMS